MMAALLVALWAPPEAAAQPDPAPPAKCTYQTYAWDTRKKKGVGHRTVSKPREELAPDEKDPDDPRCTVCSEDQARVEVEGLPPVTVCRHYAPQVEAALKAIQASGEFSIRTLKGYRVGRTRGAVRAGLRTQFSNHSYGTAIDINARENGLYRRCRLEGAPQTAKDIAHCKLGVGGAWDPARRPRQTIRAGDVVHREFTRFWRWGGALPGALKDFMHFSITGE